MRKRLGEIPGGTWCAAFDQGGDGRVQASSFNDIDTGIKELADQFVADCIGAGMVRAGPNEVSGFLQMGQIS
jgi:hypothetical protein